MSLATSYFGPLTFQVGECFVVREPGSSQSSRIKKAVQCSHWLCLVTLESCVFDHWFFPSCTVWVPVKSICMSLASQAQDRSGFPARNSTVEECGPPPCPVMDQGTTTLCLACGHTWELTWLPSFSASPRLSLGWLCHLPSVPQRVSSAETVLQDFPPQDCKHLSLVSLLCLLTSTATSVPRWTCSSLNPHLGISNEAE